MAGLGFNYPQPVVALGVSELRQTIIFQVRPDADFVLMGGQATAPFSSDGRTFAEVGIILRDFNKKAYSNDFIPLDVLFGAGSFPATIPIGSTPSFISPLGPGPGQPGLAVPQIYLPKNHQLLYDLKRTDGSGGANQAETFVINFIGQKAFAR
jgi:hypothetical protein